MSRSNWSYLRRPSRINLKKYSGCCFKGWSTPIAWSCQGQTDSIQDVRREIAYKSVLAGFCLKGRVCAHCLIVSRSNWSHSRCPRERAYESVHACCWIIEPSFGTGHNLSLICQLTSKDIKHHFIIMLKQHSSGAVWESRWPSWAVRPNEPSGFRGRKELLNRASALVTTCP